MASQDSLIQHMYDYKVQESLFCRVKRSSSIDFFGCSSCSQQLCGRSLINVGMANNFRTINIFASLKAWIHAWIGSGDEGIVVSNWILAQWIYFCWFIFVIQGLSFQVSNKVEVRRIFLQVVFLLRLCTAERNSFTTCKQVFSELVDEGQQLVSNIYFRSTISSRKEGPWAVHLTF